MKVPRTDNQASAMLGFSVLELLIVITMISVVSGFALLQIAQARQNMSRSNAAQQFAAYLEKARLDSVRRHPAAPAQMAQVTIVNANSYSVTVDSDGDGALDTARVIPLSSAAPLIFNGPFPRTIYFNGRGRTVNSANVLQVPALVTISNSFGSSSISVTDAGQPAVDKTITSSTVGNSAAPAPNFRSKTQLP